jgi:hypothetical protein
MPHGPVQFNHPHADQKLTLCASRRGAAPGFPQHFRIDTDLSDRTIEPSGRSASVGPVWSTSTMETYKRAGFACNCLLGVEMTLSTAAFWAHAFSDPKLSGLLVALLLTAANIDLGQSGLPRARGCKSGQSCQSPLPPAFFSRQSGGRRGGAQPERTRASRKGKL